MPPASATVGSDERRSARWALVRTQEGKLSSWAVEPGSADGPHPVLTLLLRAWAVARVEGASFRYPASASRCLQPPAVACDGDPRLSLPALETQVSRPHGQAPTCDVDRDPTEASFPGHPCGEHTWVGQGPVPPAIAQPAQ